MPPDLEQRVFVPQNLPDLFSILKRRPECVLWAGGTYIGTNAIARLDAQNRDIISLQKIEDLSKIMRTDRFIEFGAGVSLERILKLNAALLPMGLRKAIVATVPSPTRNLATIGGNLCIPDRILNLLPWFATIEARLELRRQGGNRFVPASRFLNDLGIPDLEIGELLTRIRIPLGHWNHHVYQRIDGAGGDATPTFAFIGLAEVHNELLEDLRVCFAFSNRTWYLQPVVDAELIGRRLPLSEKEIADYSYGGLDNALEKGLVVDPLLKYRYLNAAAWFLRTMPRNPE